jgi:hypothetical protein
LDGEHPKDEILDHYKHETTFTPVELSVISSWITLEDEEISKLTMSAICEVAMI